METQRRRHTVVLGPLRNDAEISNLTDLFLSCDNGLAFTLGENEVLHADRSVSNITSYS